MTRHPVTGRQFSFVNLMYTQEVSGIDTDQAGKLIDELARHVTPERFVHYHQRRIGDLVMRDEQATMHRGAGDHHPAQRRVMMRTIVYSK
jgi:alpha-ketoglutarate-dependent taurine dioxygenase